MNTDIRSLLIEGRWQGSERSMWVSNPYSGAQIRQVACASAEHVSAAVQGARQGLKINRHLSTQRRAELLRETAALVAERAESFAQCISGENGKPITAARKEVDRCINTLNLSAEEATRIVGETINFDSFGGDQRSGYYYYQPLGIIVAITPFNDPLNLVAHKLGPAIAAGNSIILKPSEQAPLSALMLVEAFLEAGLPAGIISVLTGYGREFGAQLVGAPDVAMVSFTGGERAGEAIAADAGAKKLAMELGSNSPVIVSAECQLPLAVKSCVAGAFWASGQNCIGVQRIYIHHSRYRDFASQFVTAVEGLSVGNPLEEGTDVGPMITAEDVRRVEDWVCRAVARGARLLCGGQPLDGGCFAPTVLDLGEAQVDVTDEEVFGPVVSLHSYRELDDAIERANRPDYLIHGAIFTDSLQEAMYVSSALDCSGVLINDSTDYRLDAMPFGGAKRGALGREGVKYAIREMVQTKTVCMNLVN